VLDNFGKKDEVELGSKRWLRCAQIPMSCFQAMSRHVRQMWPGKVHHNSTVVPQFGGHKGQLSSTYIQDINRMGWSQCSKSLNTFFVTGTVS
jgi:hypothetical protein